MPMSADIHSAEKGTLTFCQAIQGGRTPMLFADDADILAFGGGDQFVGEQGHVLSFENALVVLIVGAFVRRRGPRFGRSDWLAGDAMKDGAALRVRHGARDA